MKLPANAFAERRPGGLKPGSLFRFRGSWSLRVALSASARDQAFIVLTGPYVGRLCKIVEGMSPALSVVPPFAWFPAVELDGSATPDAPQCGGIAIIPEGPVIVSRDVDLAAESQAFLLDGSHCANYRSTPVVTRYSHWTVELAAAERQFRSLGTLFTVNVQSSRD